MATIPEPRIEAPSIKWARDPTNPRARTDNILVHHSESSGVNQDIQDVNEWHRARGWAGVGYHFVILLGGRIQKGRPTDSWGAHCADSTGNYNGTTVAVCLMGSLTSHLCTRAQWASLRSLCAWLCQRYHLDSQTILGHRDRQANSCPGDAMYAALPRLREDVHNMLAGNPVAEPLGTGEVSGDVPEAEANGLPAWARESMDWMLAEGLYSEARGNDPVTRAELAVVLRRFAGWTP